MHAGIAGQRAKLEERARVIEQQLLKLDLSVTTADTGHDLEARERADAAIDGLDDELAQIDRDLSFLEMAERDPAAHGFGPDTPSLGPAPWELER